MSKYRIVTITQHQREYIIEADSAQDAEDAFHEHSPCALVRTGIGREVVQEVLPEVEPVEGAQSDGR